jgi:Proteolipid membrane potential modulator
MISGCGADLIINLFLTLLGFFPGHIHAFYLEYVYFDRREKGKIAHAVRTNFAKFTFQAVLDNSALSPLQGSSRITFKREAQGPMVLSEEVKGQDLDDYGSNARQIFFIRSDLWAMSRNPIV